MLYDYRCDKCGRETEAINRIAERKTNAPVCCDTKMTLFISQAPYGFIDREVRYKCVVTNQEVTSRRQRNEIMARHNLIDANDIVNKKTIQAAIDEKERIKSIAEAHRLPKHLEGQFKSLEGVLD